MDPATAMILAEIAKGVFSVISTAMRTAGANEEEIAVMWKTVGDEFMKNSPDTFPN